MSHADVNTTFQRRDDRPLLLLNDFVETASTKMIAVILLAVLVFNQTHIETNDKIKLLGSLELLLRLSFHSRRRFDRVLRIHICPEGTRCLF